MNFFRIFFALCSGTEVIPKLISHSLIRVFGHLILLLLLCATGTTTVCYFRDRNMIAETTRRFFQRTGNIEITKKAVRLTEHPADSRSYTVNLLRFDYFSAPGDFIPASVAPNQYDFTIFCFSTGAALRIRDFAERENPRYRVFLLPADMLYSIFAKAAITPEELTQLTEQRDKLLAPAGVYETIRKGLLEPERLKKAESMKKHDTYVLTSGEMSTRLSVLFASMSCMFFLAEAVLALLLSITFFSIAQLIRSSHDPVRVPFKSCLTATVYATFPPLVIASMVYALKLTFPSFQTVYFVAFFIYQIFVFRTLFRHYDPRSLRDDNSER